MPSKRPFPNMYRPDLYAGAPPETREAHVADNFIHRHMTRAFAGHQPGEDPRDPTSRVARNVAELSKELGGLSIDPSRIIVGSAIAQMDLARYMGQIKGSIPEDFSAEA